MLLLLLLWRVGVLGSIPSLCSIALVGIGAILLLILLRVGILGTVSLVVWLRVVVLLAVLVCVVWVAAVCCLMINSRAPGRGASICLGSWHATILLMLSSQKVWRRSPGDSCAGILHWQTLFSTDLPPRRCISAHAFAYTSQFIIFDRPVRMLLSWRDTSSCSAEFAEEQHLWQWWAAVGQGRSCHDSPGPYLLGSSTALCNKMFLCVSENFSTSVTAKTSLWQVRCRLAPEFLPRQ